MSMTTIQEINAAIHALHAAGCVRDPATGRWLTRDHLALDSDPLEAASELRRETMRRAVDHEIRANGGRFNREYSPNGIR